METHKKFKIEQNALRIYVVGTGILMTIYCAMLCFGIRHLAAELMCVTFGYLLLCGGAWMFRVCWLTWAFIAYTYAVRICIILYNGGYFEGEFFGLSVLNVAHHIAFTVGFVLTVCFCCKFGRYIKLLSHV